jgi:MOSC domain-containing protein YiiM
MPTTDTFQLSGSDDELHVAMADLLAALPALKKAPSDNGTVEMICRRPGTGDRELVSSATLDAEAGLVGDNWFRRGSSRTPDHRAHPDMQLTIMNARAIALVARSRDRWPLAGDQIFADLDLSVANLPPGARLQLGDAIIQITHPPHLGCAKFHARFGPDALAFVNSEEGRALRLRGVNARIVTGGLARVGDRIQKLVAG